MKDVSSNHEEQKVCERNGQSGEKEVDRSERNEEMARQNTHWNDIATYWLKYVPNIPCSQHINKTHVEYSLVLDDI